MQVKDVKNVLIPLNRIYVIEKVFIGSLLTDEFDKSYKNFDEFLEDKNIDNFEVDDRFEPVNYEVHGFRFIEEIDIWLKEEQND